MYRVLLFGPIVAHSDGAYGGGTGGYTRKMLLYLDWFKDQDFKIIPCYHSIRGQSKKKFLGLRLLKDLWTFLINLWKIKPRIIHILAQYRTAIYREFLVIFISRICRIPVVYEIKAGVFLTWFSTTGVLNKHLCLFCLKHSKIILCQGKSYVDFLTVNYPGKVYYHPNFVPLEEIPHTVNSKLEYPEIRILFVGYQFKEKGVFQLVEACLVVAKELQIELTFIGKEHPEFKSWLDSVKVPSSLKINRMGIIPHDKLHDYYQRNDIYCYPTTHSGEGHNNTINEAMMMGMVIVTTHQGFLPDILDPDSAYFLDDTSPISIAGCLVEISNERQIARKKAFKARQLLLANYTSQVAFDKLKTYYKRLV